MGGGCGDDCLDHLFHDFDRLNDLSLHLNGLYDFLLDNPLPLHDNGLNLGFAWNFLLDDDRLNLGANLRLSGDDDSLLDHHGIATASDGRDQCAAEHQWSE